MKKILFSLLITILITSTASAKMVSVATDDAAMRTGASSAYQVKMTLVKYYPLTVLDTLGKWIKVKDWMNNSGWVHEDDVSDTRACIVRKMRINMRSGPSTRYRKLDTLYKGFILKIDRKNSTKYWIRGTIVDPAPEEEEKPIIGWVHYQLVWGY